MLEEKRRPRHAGGSAAQLVKAATRPAPGTPAQAAQEFTKRAKMEEPVLFGKLVIVGK